MNRESPRQAVMGIPGLAVTDARDAAVRATVLARQYMPRATGGSAGTLSAIWGVGWFGVEWTHDSIWYQESGIRPFTMRSLAGKTIPMWVKDRDGEHRRKNPSIETRVREDTGETEVKIFRRAANRGQRKMAWRQRGGRMVRVDVPMSYPGAPGRIAVNRSRGIMRAGDVNPDAPNPGEIARGNVGVRWRHPGLDAGRHIMRGLSDAADEMGLTTTQVRYLRQGTLTEGANYEILMTGR